MNKNYLDDSSFYLNLTHIAPRPETAHNCLNARLLQLSSPAAVSMARLADHFGIQANGRVLNPASPAVVRKALRAWFQYLGGLLEAGGLLTDAEKQIYPIPCGCDRHQVSYFFVGHEAYWPSRNVLLHVLYSIGISPFTITAASLLHHATDNPATIKADTGRKSTDERQCGGTSQFHRIIKQENKQF